MAAYRAMSGELPQPSSRTRSKTSPIVTPLSPSKSTVTAFHETTLDVPASANDEEIDPDPGADVDPGMTACLAISNDLPQLAAHTYPKQVTISTRSPLKSHSTSLSSSQEKILLTEAASGDAGSNSTAMPIRTGPKTTAVKSGPQSAKSSLVYIASSSPRVVKSSDSVFDPAATGFKTIDGRRASIASKRTTTSSASLKSPGAGSSQNSGGRVSNVTSRSRIPTPSKKASEAGNETSATASQQASREHSQKSSVMSRHDPRNKGSSPAPGYMNGSIHDVLGPLSDENGAQEKYKVIQSDSASLDSEKRGKCSSNNRIFGKLELEIETDETDPATAIGSETFPNCEPSQRLMTASRNLNIFQKVSTESNEFVGPDTAALPDFNESIILKTATIPATIHKERLQPESKHVQPAPLLSEPQMAGHLNHDGSMFIPISAYRTGSESTSATQSLERLKQIEVQFKGSTRRCSFNTTSIVNARPLRGANIKNSTDKLNEVKAVAESIGSLHATVAKINTSTGGSYHNLSPKFHHSHVSVSRSLSSENFKSAPHSGSTKTSKSNFIEVEQGGGSLNETINTLTTAKTESPTPKHTQSATYSGSVQAAINSLSSAEKKSTDSRIMQTTSNINDSTQNITSKLQGRNSRNGAKAVSKSSIIETISRLSKPKSSPVTPKYNSRSNVVVSVSNNSNNNASHRRSTGNMTKSSGKLELNAVKATKVPEILTSRQPSARPDKASSVEMIKSQSRSTNSAESKADSVTVDQFVSRESHQPSQNEFGKPSGKPNDSDAESFCSVTSRELGLTGGEVPSASGEHLGNSNLKNAETVFKHFLDLDDMKTVQNSNNNLANQQQQRSNQLLIHDYMAPITTHSSEPQKADSASVFKHYMDLDEMKAQPTRTSWQALSPHKKQTPKSSRQGIVSKPTHPQKADTASVFKHYMDVDEMKERSAQSSSYALSSQKRTPKLNRSGSLNPTPKNSGQKNNASMFKHYMDLDEMKGSSSRNSEQSLAAQSRKSSTIGGNSTPEHSISMQTKRVQKADNASVASHYLDLDDMKETIFRNGARTISTHIPKPQAESNKKGIRSTQTTPTHKVHDQKDDTASVFKHFMDLDETREASVRSSVNNFRSKENAGIQPNFINKHPDLLATREDFVVHKVPSRASFSANEDDEEFSSCLDFPQSQLDALKSSMKTFLAEDLVNFSHHQNETSKRAVDAPFKSTPSLTGASSSSPIPDEKPNSFTPDPRRVVEAMISNLYAALRPYLKEADWARAMAAQTLSNQLHKELAYLFVDQSVGGFKGAHEDS
ncbi:hypothetical protein BC830DRAFT_790687 [Chytriomyces sp. MP71]|nr:hypothetical protein BC830DRAFT_790687 [Chytriomyces sp. MP71]